MTVHGDRPATSERIVEQGNAQRTFGGAAHELAQCSSPAWRSHLPRCAPAEYRAACGRGDVEGDPVCVRAAAHARYKDIEEGANADYIPALAKVDPRIYGIALVTPDGKTYTAGDVKSEVSIQSISKVFTMAKVMEEPVPDAILKRIGAEATGMRFNSIVSIEFAQHARGGPEINPLVNPGAIAATSMVQGATRDEIWKKIVSFHSDFAGRTAQHRRGSLCFRSGDEPAQSGDWRADVCVRLHQGQPGSGD